MTPKEKAEELVDNFKMKVLDRDGTSAMNYFEIKQCALITVDEMITYGDDRVVDFLVEVKQEIEAL